MLRRLRPIVIPALVLLALVLLVIPRVAAAAQRGHRLALVVGNGDYVKAPLATPLNDAGLIAQALARADFDVTALGNADAATLRRAFAAFIGKVQDAGPDTIVFVYLAGYGVQYDGDNFFAPIDARIARDTDVPRQALPLSELAQPLEASPARARILVYDLARATPFVDVGLPLASGLGLPISPNGTLTALNAAPGTVAARDLPPYGAYARALAEMIATPGLRSDTLFQRVRLRVSQQTDGETIPSETGTADFVFVPSQQVAPVAADEPPLAGLAPDVAFASCVRRDTLAADEEFLRAFPNDRLSARVRQMEAVRREALIWSESLRVDTARAYWTYMRRYPRGPHFGDVRRRLAALHVALEPPPRFDIYDYADAPAPPAGEMPLADTPNRMLAGPGWPPIPPLPTAFLAPRPAAYGDGLMPPPVVPANALPIPLVGGVTAKPGLAPDEGQIVETNVAGYGPLLSERRGAVVTTTSDGRVLSRTTEADAPATRIVTQTNGSGAIITKTVLTHGKDQMLILQTGPTGSVLSRTIVNVATDGTRTSTITNAKDEVVASSTTSRDGIVTGVVFGTVAPDEETFVLLPEAADGAPVVVTTAQAKKEASRAPSLPVLATAPGRQRAGEVLLTPPVGVGTGVRRPTKASPYGTVTSRDAGPAPQWPGDVKPLPVGETSSKTEPGSSNPSEGAPGPRPAAPTVSKSEPADRPPANK